MRKISLLLALALLTACNSEEPTEVLVLPTLHGAHEMNMNYTYDDLLATVKAYDPDVIGVEIRPIDMQLDSDSLDVFYPIEMIRVRDSFPNKTSGIDFYSQQVENETVNRKMFVDSTTQMGRIKRLQRDMGQDSLLISRYEALGIPELQKNQQRIALNYSAEEMINGEYDSLTGRQYQLEDSLFKNSIYEEYSSFNNNRDLQITKNALQLVENNPGKKVLLLVGANHRNRLVDSLQARNEKIELVRDLNFMKAQK
ncbi:MAG: hypothetical protein WBL27_05550 [Salinimicrobium sp.]